jgi:hypothetical protein
VITESDAKTPHTHTHTRALTAVTRRGSNSWPASRVLDYQRIALTATGKRSSPQLFTVTYFELKYVSLPAVILMENNY